MIYHFMSSIVNYTQSRDGLKSQGKMLFIKIYEESKMVIKVFEGDRLLKVRLFRNKYQHSFVYKRV